MLTEQLAMVVAVLELVRIEAFVAAPPRGERGRPQADRQALARAFVAQATYGVVELSAWRERLRQDPALRTVCGWPRRQDVPSLATFSRAFAAFAHARLPDQVHPALVTTAYHGHLVWHVARDATAIPVRERPCPHPPAPRPPHRRGRTGITTLAQARTRLERQRLQAPAEALAELPTACDVAAKRNAQGRWERWAGYKLHLDVSEEGVPLAAITTAASVHDSQVAIPLAKLTATRVAALYDLMDRAYDATLIHATVADLGRVPIVEPARRGAPRLPADRRRHLRGRGVVERVFSLLKDRRLGRGLRLRGHPKIHAHLLFGVLVLAAEALLRQL